MKIKYTILALLMSCITFSSCTDFLEESSNPNYLTPDTFWQTEDDIKSGLTAAYARLQPSQDWDRTTDRFVIIDNFRSDETDFRADVTERMQLATYTYETGNYICDYEWELLFSGINFANQCIDNIPTVEDADEDVKTIGVAEARFLRAYFYFRLYMSFGDRLPILEHAIEGTEEEFYPDQAASGEVQAFLESELLDVQTDLPDVGYWSDSEAGRVTKYAAAGILAKYYMFTNQLSKAEVELKKIIDSQKYDLIPEYGDLFNGSAKNSVESILEVQFSGQLIDGNRERNLFTIQLAPSDLGGYEQSYPSQWLFETLKNDKTVDGEYSPRLYATILFDDPNTEFFLFPDGSEFKDVLPTSMIYWHKFCHFDESLGSGSWEWYSGLNYPIVRYADVLLLYAECLNDRGETDLAIDYINIVRDRSNLVQLSKGMTKEQILTHLQEVERPGELGFEGSRWYDLIRWGITSETLIKNGKPYATSFREDKHTLLPIPSEEFLLNDSWVQNPNFGK